jgi:RNA polymerase sigma-70 factor (ECF subfamily)
MSEVQDAADVGRVLAGDPEAFRGIVRRWQGPLVTLAFRFCRDRNRAEDMAQMAFLRAFQSLGQWRGGGAFSSWLFTVAANIYRSEMRRRRLFMLSLDAAQDIAQSDSTASCGAGLDRETRVRHAVSTLPAKYRDALVLFYFQQMNVEETARILGLAEGTIKTRLHRGRTLLRRKLGSIFADGRSEDSGDD